MCSAPHTVICLLRNDLRLHDNEVFHWAQKNARYIVPLYCFDPRNYLVTFCYNLPKTGPFRLRFLLDSLKDLRATLQKKGSNLFVRQGKPAEVISELIKQLESVSTVIFHEEVTHEELEVEKEIRNVCSQLKVKVHSCWGSTLYHRDDLPFSHISRLPDVYTQFRKAVETQGEVRPVLSTPDMLKPFPAGLEEGSIPALKDLGQTGNAPANPRSAFPYHGGESQALARLQHYFWDTDAVARYKETRNGLIGVNYSTKFAPWLANGLQNQEKGEVIFELLWRDFFRFVAMKHGNKIFSLNGLQDKALPWKKDISLFNAWKEGRTGVPFVDANMRELAQTGFMSNRGRQNVASFFTKDLGLDWRMGAEWFEYLLVDYDVCSNYGNWLYSAGIGNDPRENRKFNVIKQGLDYDNNGDYVRQWVPELQGISGCKVHTPWTLSKDVLSKGQVTLDKTYPFPVVMASEWSHHDVSGPGPRGRRGLSHTPKHYGNRGIDFYFSRNKNLK
uniref:Cryptochrome DASH n=1 Tax=Scleropages formosus TaxID=113540 RepID=A0A8C9RML5_SCLFO